MLFILIKCSYVPPQVLNLGGGQRGYGKFDLPKVNITWYLELAGN